MYVATVVFECFIDRSKFLYLSPSHLCCIFSLRVFFASDVGAGVDEVGGGADPLRGVVEMASFLRPCVVGMGEALVR
jgi:hypothetical protein